MTKTQLYSRLEAAKNNLQAIQSDVRKALPASGAIDWRIALEGIAARAAACLEEIK